MSPSTSTAARRCSSAESGGIAACDAGQQQCVTCRRPAADGGTVRHVQVPGAGGRRRNTAYRNGLLSPVKPAKGTLAARLSGEGEGKSQDPRAAKPVLGVKKWECEVVSNRNISTFLKEFVREASRRREPEVPQRRLYPDRHSEVRRHQVLRHGHRRSSTARIGTRSRCGIW